MYNSSESYVKEYGNNGTLSTKSTHLCTAITKNNSARDVCGTMEIIFQHKLLTEAGFIFCVFWL
jgi:hypothetical protein